jgi:hypothetical protein
MKEEAMTILVEYNTHYLVKYVTEFEKYIYDGANQT